MINKIYQYPPLSDNLKNSFSEYLFSDKARAHYKKAHKAI